MKAAIKKAVASISFCLLLGTGLQSASAQTSAPPPPARGQTQPAQQPQQQDMGGYKFLWDYTAQLGLTQEELGKMHGSFNLFQKEMISLKAKLQLSEMDLEELMDQNADMKLIEAQVLKSAAVEGEMRFYEIKMNHDIIAVLSPTQLKQWHQILLQSQNQAASNQAPPANAPSGK